MSTSKLWMQREKKLFRHKLKTSCDLLATAKNVFPFTSSGGVAPNLVLSNLRGMEFDLRTRFLIPVPAQKISWVESENIFTSAIST